ncbi:N-acetylmuramoyl-L-alanine amidase [Gottfriedia sp. NPDC056225]|uniref:peptidoglycan recognition protein family protein n=1 Tax=Gottfriedia sp. NPDC056225 TaxID=3345751 RepID=UPI001558BD5A|nr:N-acetylmuramoyl-L-alanine amidase [Arthrobacter citreus]
MAYWRNDFISMNKYTRPSIKLKGVKKIVIHWTANPGASAQSHQRYFNGSAIKNKTYASAHIFVDSKEAICIIPLDEVAYHANDHYERNSSGGVYRGVPELAPNANKLSIGVEMCLEKDGTVSQYTITRAVRVVAELCKMFKLDANDIVRHYDITHKPCPKTFIDHPERFNEFKAQVNAVLNPPKQQADSIPYPGILNMGSKGESVKHVQQKLNITADGIFGPVTESAVKKFQASNGLVVDGIVGKNTWSKLF